MRFSTTLVTTLILTSVPCLAIFADDADAEAKLLVAKARELARAKDFDGAIALMKKAGKLAPANDRYLAMRSEFELKAGKFSDGLDDAIKAIALNGKEGSYYVLAAWNAYGSHDLDKTRAYSEQVLNKGPNVFGREACQEAVNIQDLLIKKTFTLFWNLDPKKGQSANGALVVALPKSGLPYQTVTYETEGVKSHRFIKGDVNDVLSIVPQGTKPFALTIKVVTQPYSYEAELARATAKPPPAEAKAFLGPFLTADPKSPTLRKAVAGLKAPDTTATVRNILKWLKNNIDYKIEQKDSLLEHDFKNVDEIVRRGHAECRGYALLFTALCRACDIPARPIWGLYRVRPGKDQKLGMVSHNWAEVYISGSGWLPVDPQGAETFGFLPNNYVRFVMDARKSPTSTETRPILNLIFMNGGKLRFEEARYVATAPSK